METTAALKIFIVDDDLFSLSLYEQHLKNLGIEDVTGFSNGTDCLDQLILQPDLIFLDHNMDIMNGVEVLRRIKRFNPNIQVVFISGQEDVATAVNSLKYGAFDYIVKGGDDLEKIGRVLQKYTEVKALLPRPGKGLFKKIFSKF